MTTTINANVTANVAPVNATVSVEKKEEIKMTREMIREALRKNGIEMSNKEFKATKKDQLMDMLLDVEQSNHVSEEKEEQTMVTDEKVVVTVEAKTQEKKSYKDMTVEEKKADALLGKWDKLVKAVAKEYVDQSIGKSWALFYKNTKSTTIKADYLVKTKKIWGATSKVIKNLYGEDKCDANSIQQTLNVMVIRGHINYSVVPGKDGAKNIVFSASKDQMNAMYKLSK